jgi:hypothetical protein
MRMEKESYIWITTQFEGFHSYPNAPNDVKFLRYQHRHIFKLKIYIEVFHNDREIEFFQFKKFIEDFIKKNKLKLNNLSCESISDTIWAVIYNKYQEREIYIEVSEDGENGSFKKYRRLP